MQQKYLFISKAYLSAIAYSSGNKYSQTLRGKLQVNRGLFKLKDSVSQTSNNKFTPLFSHLLRENTTNFFIDFR